jgi:hypothetical protein
MGKWISLLMACVFLAVASAPNGFAQEKKREQVHKGTPEAQSSVQK